ncbi:MAG: DUF177 domain-containing protein [Bacilli bacterium]|nr:DUF177 domain-containing protein [Bacilli bacterium]
MIIDITKLKSNIVDKIDIDESINVDEELLKETDIIELKDTSVKGFITKDDLNSYNLNVIISGTMVLPCSVSLKPTNYDFSCSIDENIEELLEELGKTLKNSENTIDIFPIIWENILMEIPMHIVNEDIHDVKLSGDGWRVITEVEDDSESVNPELQKLKDLLK